MSYISEDASVSSSDDKIESMDLLRKRLKTALFNLKSKEDLVKQHIKVTEEAIAGWEAAEKEAENYKQKAEASFRKISALEDRVSQLDGALKECLKQLREARDGQEEKVGEGAGKQTKELENTKIKFENQVLELRSMLNAMRAVPAPPPDAAYPELRLKLEALERDTTSLRLQLSSQSENLEVARMERDLSTKAAESASKQLLEGLKKAAKLEAECRRLRATVNRSGSSSIADTHSDSSERVYIDFHRPTPDLLPAEIDLMDDFLEMERLVSLPPDVGPTPDAGPTPAAGERLKEAMERIEGMERQLSSMNSLKLSMEAELRKGKDEADALSGNVEYLTDEVRRERAYVAEWGDRCRELERQLARKNEELESSNRARADELKAKQEAAEGKMAECQKTISSLRMQLKGLVSVDDVLDGSGSF